MIKVTLLGRSLIHVCIVLDGLESCRKAGE